MPCWKCQIIFNLINCVISCIINSKSINRNFWSFSITRNWERFYNRFITLIFCKENKELVRSFFICSSIYTKISKEIECFRELISIDFLFFVERRFWKLQRVYFVSIRIFSSVPEIWSSIKIIKLCTFFALGNFYYFQFFYFAVIAGSSFNSKVSRFITKNWFTWFRRKNCNWRRICILNFKIFSYCVTFYRIHISNFNNCIIITLFRWCFKGPGIVWFIFCT